MAPGEHVSDEARAAWAEAEFRRRWHVGPEHDVTVLKVGDAFVLLAIDGRAYSWNFFPKRPDKLGRVRLRWQMGKPLTPERAVRSAGARRAPGAKDPEALRHLLAVRDDDFPRVLRRALLLATSPLLAVMVIVLLLGLFVD